MGWQDAPEVKPKAAWESAPEVNAKAPAEPQREQAALGGVNRGIAGLVGLPVDAAANIIDLVKAGAGAAYGLASGNAPPTALDPMNRAQVPGSSEYIANLMQRGGINTQNPSPQDPASRMLYTGGMIAGGSMVPGARPVPAALAATGGALAGELGGPEWTGVGAMIPGAVGQAGRDVKGMVDARRVQENINTFREANTRPTVAQATENTFLRGLENLVSRVPGGTGIYKRFVENQQADMGTRARTGVDAEDAGRAIETGVQGFLARTRATWQRLDADLAAKMPKGSSVLPTNTIQALDELTRATPGAEQTSTVLRTGKMVAIREALQGDLAGTPGQQVSILGPNGTPLSTFQIGGTPGKQTLPYEALRELRSRVGQMMDDSLVADIPQGELKRLYGALSKDMEAAANAAGAGREFARQNQYYAARMGRIETTLDRVIGKNRQPEDIFNLLTPKNPDQVNKLRQVMRSLEPAERQVVTDAVVNRLGRATPGKQEFEEKFSSETFLTNWSKLGVEAKRQLFPNDAQRNAVESLARTASNIREGAEVFKNPSGTAGTLASYGLGMSFLGGVMSGNVPAAAGAAGIVGATNITARMLTSPRIVQWLAQGTRQMTPGEQASHLARLSVLYNNADDATKEDLANFVGGR